MKIVTRIVSLCMFVVLMAGAVYAQPKQAFVEKSDPDAVKILQKIQKIYGEYDGIALDYTLEMEYGEDKEVQKGSILQQGKKYFINNNGNLIINDGSTVWMYIKKQNEVQINDYIEEDDDFTPTKIFRMGENDDFVYVITGEDSQGYHIEFKPRDRDSEIKKVRLLVDRSQTTIKSVKVFSEDGSRMTFLIKDIENVKPAGSSFIFNKAKYPGVVEIDLRD
ncbi:MAG: LolA family protein [Aureispira sp.]